MHRKKNNTNSDVTTSKKVLCRVARIAETITGGRPTYIKFTQAVNKTTPPPTNPTPGNQNLRMNEHLLPDIISHNRRWPGCSSVVLIFTILSANMSLQLASSMDEMLKTVDVRNVLDFIKETHFYYNKNLCGRDGRTICGPLPKSTCVSF